MTGQMMSIPSRKENMLVLERQMKLSNGMNELACVCVCVWSIYEERTMGERVLGKLTECLSLLTASVMAWVSTSSKAQHMFFTVCTSRSTVLYWVL